MIQADLGLTQDGWHEDAIARAKALYPPPSRLLGSLLARTHRYAIDYLEQCPALLPFAAYGYSEIPDARHRLLIAERFGSRIRKGLALKHIVRDLGGTYPARRFKGSILFPKFWPVLIRLKDFDPIELANMIPEKASDQRIWLRCLLRIDAFSNNRPIETGQPFRVWAAKATSTAIRDGNKTPDQETAEVIDLVFRGGRQLNPKWTWESARAEGERWHRELAQKRDAENFAKRFRMSMTDKVDYAHLPAIEHVNGFEFLALQTGEDLYTEGSAMRHCVASYMGDVITGTSRIYSIRQNGSRVATLELVPGLRVRWKAVDGSEKLSHGNIKSFPLYRIAQLKSRFNGTPPKPVWHAAEAFRDLVNGVAE